MKPEVYILQLNNGQYYIGSTNDLDRRFIEHQSGMTTSIKYKLPCKIVFHQELTSYAEARRAEIFIKKQKSRVFNEKIINNEIDLNTFPGGPVA